MRHQRQSHKVFSAFSNRVLFVWCLLCTSFRTNFLITSESSLINSWILELHFLLYLFQFYWNKFFFPYILTHFWSLLFIFNVIIFISLVGSVSHKHWIFIERGNLLSEWILFKFPTPHWVLSFVPFFNRINICSALFFRRIPPLLDIIWNWNLV